MLNQIRILKSECKDPYINLATEKYLLENTPNDCCTLYLWQNEKTVVIGKNQNAWAECNVEKLERDGIKLARRLSGGGAVYHDLGNLNFTFLCNTENYNLQKQMEVIKNACSFAGIDTNVSGRNDILTDGKKFSGNAFYSSKGKAYHHGTILIKSSINDINKYLTPDKKKLQSKGVKSVKSRVINLSEVSPALDVKKMTEYMINAFKQVYNLPCETLSNLDAKKIEITANEFNNWEYVFGSPIKFTLKAKDHLSFGQIELLLTIKNSIIEDIKVFTDSLDWLLAESIETTLKGVNFKIEDIQKALLSCLEPKTAIEIIQMIKNEI